VPPDSVKVQELPTQIVVGEVNIDIVPVEQF